MFGKKKNSKLINKVIRLNDEAAYAEKQGDLIKVLSCIDRALEMVGGIKEYQLLNWIVECNYTRYHLLYDSDVDKQESRDIFIYLRNIVKNNVSEEQFKIIKTQYALLLIDLMSLMLEGKSSELFEEILEEAVALSKDNEIETQRREYLKIMAYGFGTSYHLKLGNYAVAIHYGTTILEQVEFDDEISTFKLFFLNQLMFSYALCGQLNHAEDLGRFLYIIYL